MDTADIIPRVPKPELVFGLVGSIGTDLDLVSDLLTKALESVSYTASVHRLTDTIKDIEKDTGIDFKLREDTLEKRYNTYISAGNLLCKRMNSKEVFALFAAAQIAEHRKSITNSENEPAENHAFIIKQFKRPQEIELMRKIYGKGFYQISAFCEKEARIKALTSKISESHFRKNREEFYKSKAIDLVVRDEDEEDEEFGQRLRDTFPLGDVVIDATDKESATNGIDRFIRSIFGDAFVTPSKDELGIYAAKVAALQSADLSRQVGAAIFTSAGDVITTGCNEVPAAGGGIYWEGDEHDSRDFKLGYDSNKKFQKHILRDLFRRLQKDWLSSDKTNLSVDELVGVALSRGEQGALRDSLLTNVIEYGRIVHAEMNALSSAARLGRCVDGATLYVTTFPCHICARHILAAGISRVVYLEPYSKSLTLELYADSVAFDGGRTHQGSIPFEQFVGIGPEKYFDIFRMKTARKSKDGSALSWKRESATPILERLYEAYFHMEEKARVALGAQLEQLKKKRRPNKSSKSSKSSK